MSKIVEASTMMETVREDEMHGVRIRIYELSYWVETKLIDGWYHVAGPFNQMSDDYAFTNAMERYNLEIKRKTK